MTPTLRRLNDGERYYGLTWPGWVALGGGGRRRPLRRGSHLPVRPARDRDRRCPRDGVLRQRRAGAPGADDRTGPIPASVYRYRRAAKQLTPPTRPDKLGLVLDSAPQPAEQDESVLDGAAGMTGSLADLLPIALARARRADRHDRRAVCAGDRVRPGAEHDHRGPLRARADRELLRDTCAGSSPTAKA